MPFFVWDRLTRGVWGRYLTPLNLEPPLLFDLLRFQLPVPLRRVARRMVGDRAVERYLLQACQLEVSLERGDVVLLTSLS